MTKTLKHILCIDDEDDILTVAQLSLETVGGFSVTACSNGEEGIQKAMENKPDIIMIDVMMPGLDGPATLQKFKNNPDLSSIPIIFMTARVQEAEIQEYLDMGASDVVAKPFDPMELSGTVLNIWEKING
ncbi:MAG: response regulator [Alphaproteobacteria bacterium]|nr:response regulator [Alphaproteobacteria bacterium]